MLQSSAKPFTQLEELNQFITSWWFYYALFSLIISYGLIFWGNSIQGDYIFKLQKMIIKVKMKARPRDSCRELFKILKILLLSSQYIFSLAMFVVNNRGLFMENSGLYNIKTRNNSNHYQPLSHLAIYQKGPYYTGIKVHNNLPVQIQLLSCNITQDSSYEFSTDTFLLYFIWVHLTTYI
jgi:hypothetical protein